MPAAPEDTGPGAGEDADGVGMAAPAGAGALIDEGRPLRGVAGVVGEGREGSVWVPEILAGEFRKFWPLPGMMQMARG